MTWSSAARTLRVPGMRASPKFSGIIFDARIPAPRSRFSHSSICSWETTATGRSPLLRLVPAEKCRVSTSSASCSSSAKGNAASKRAPPRTGISTVVVSVAAAGTRTITVRSPMSFCASSSAPDTGGLRRVPLSSTAIQVANCLASAGSRMTRNSAITKLIQGCAGWA